MSPQRQPDLSQVAVASSKRGALSFQDRLCLILAREHGWTCVTNDKPLRKACVAEEVAVLWGLELMLELVREGCLEPEAAVKVARAIHTGNPLHITEALLERFVTRLHRLR